MRYILQYIQYDTMALPRRQYKREMTPNSAQTRGPLRAKATVMTPCATAAVGCALGGPGGALDASLTESRTTFGSINTFVRAHAVLLARKKTISCDAAAGEAPRGGLRALARAGSTAGTY